MRMRKTLAAMGMLVLTALLLWTGVVQAQDDFEQPGPLKAEDVLKDTPLKTAFYEIDPAVINNGVMNQFYVHAGLYIYHVKGNGLLAERLREIPATASLNEVKKSDVYLDGVKAAGKNKINNIKTLVTDPVNTLSGIPQGIERFFGNAYRAVKRDKKSPYEDSTMQQIMGFSKVKRTIAVGMGVDPYSSNTELQQALDDVAWASFAGGMSLNAVGALVVPAPVGSVLTVTQLTARVSQLIKNESPENLRKINSDTLKAVGASDRQIAGLLDSNAFSPTRQTILAECLSQMSGVKDTAAYLDWAAAAVSEEQAFFIQRSAEMLQGYHANKRPLARLHTAGGFPVGETKEGAPVMAMPLDYLLWTEKASETAKAIRADLPARLQEKPLAFLAEGRVSERAAGGLKGLNFAVEQNWRASSAPAKP